MDNDTPETAETACQVPLIERLRSVPPEARQMIQQGYCNHRNIPYGLMCHEAAEMIADLQRQRDEAQKEVRYLENRLTSNGFTVHD